MNVKLLGDAAEPSEGEPDEDARRIRKYVKEGIEEADRGETFPWNTAEIIEKAQQQQRDLAAIKEAIALWEAGDEGLPVDEAMAEIRAKHEARTQTGKD